MYGNFVDILNENNVKKVLLVEPEFPIANKSKNHSDFLPIGLLKIATYLRERSIEVKLIRYESGTEKEDYDTDLVFVTSIFTYWSEYVKDAVKYCKENYNAPVVVGGIYASLMPEHCKENTNCDYIITGIIPEVEGLIPAYDLVDVDYQIIHTTRGCIRKCGFCGTYKIEPEWLCKKSIKNEIIKKKVIIYDNNFLANPYVEDILRELISLKKQRKISYIESQSGFDGRIMRKNPHLAELIKEAGFKSPKIAWDHGLGSYKAIEKQVNILTSAGFKPKDISVFMIYNYNIDYNEMEQKRVKCFEWGVQITDCRYRPLEATFDNYNPRKYKGQTSEDYWINPNWTDEQVRLFRRNVRRHNICIRHDTDYHSVSMERKKVDPEDAKRYRSMDYDEVKMYLNDAWCPSEVHLFN